MSKMYVINYGQNSLPKGKKRIELIEYMVANVRYIIDELFVSLLVDQIRNKVYELNEKYKGTPKYVVSFKWPPKSPFFPFIFIHIDGRPELSFSLQLVEIKGIWDPF